MSNVRKPDFNEYAKIPPHDINIEKNVLGYLINLDKMYQDALFNILKPEFFYSESHQKLFKIFHQLYLNDTLNLLSIINECKQQNILDEVGGPAYISEIKKYTVKKIKTAITHCKHIFQKYTQREIIRITTNSSRLAYNEEDIKKNIETTINKLNKLYEQNNDETVTDQQNAADESLKDIINKSKRNIKPYYRTNIDGIDDLLKISGENVMIIAGKSGSGKTKFLSYLMYKLLTNNPDDIEVSWYALEDGKNKSQRAFISMLTLLTDDDLQSKSDRVLSESDIQRIVDAYEKIKNFPIEWHTNRKFIRDIEKEFEVFVNKKEKSKLKVLIVDNLNKLSDTGRTQLDRDIIIGEAVGDMHDKYLNKDNVIIILIHHYSDEQLDKSNLNNAYVPTEKNVKGSGKYREISTQLLLTHNPGQFNDLVIRYSYASDILKRLFLVSIPKNRGGSLGNIKFFMSLEYNIFEPFYFKKQ
jgi:replicative DNA helicase